MRISSPRWWVVGFGLTTLIACARQGEESLLPMPENAAVREAKEALAAEPDLANGLRIYRSCVPCHRAEGWGARDGSVPQIAGQHRAVVVKQLADVRAGNRSIPTMYPVAAYWNLGGPQAVADVAGYVATLPMTVENEKGPGDDLGRGEALYASSCVDCHGVAGGGDAEARVPRLQSQHYAYLVRQLEWIRSGRRGGRRHAMAGRIASFTLPEVRAIADFLSRVPPPASLQAPPGWHNPDFPRAHSAPRDSN